MDQRKAKSEQIKILNVKKNLYNNKTIVVLGVGRGGTSVVAGVLRELGVVMPNAHPLKHEWSPVRFDSHRSVDFPSTVQTLRMMDERHRVWGWKNPGDVFLIEQIQSQIRNPAIIIVFRNFLDTCCSGAKYGDFPWELSAEENAEVIARLAHLITYSNLPIAAVSYENLLEEPNLVVNELNEWLCLDATPPMISSATSFVSPNTGYHSISYEPHDGFFAASEIFADKSIIQLHLYSRMATKLTEATRALLSELDEANNVFSAMTSDFDSKITGGFILGEDTGFDDHSKRPEPDHIYDITNIKTAVVEYESIKARYLAVLNERIIIQRKLDGVAMKLKRLKKKSD